MYDELISALREEAEWAEANEWETPITLSDHLKQAADAIEELANTVKHQSDILHQYGGETGIRQAFESADGWAKMAAEYKAAYIAEHDSRIAECKCDLTEKEQEAHNAFLTMAARCGQAEEGE